MARSQVTLDIAGISIAVVIHSLDPLERGSQTHHDSIDIALRWSADAGRNRVLLTSHRIYYGISIAFLIHSLDPLE